jgi:integrase/recombinase XerD
MKAKSFLSHKFNDYIHFRKSYGFKVVSDSSNLMKFDQYLCSSNAKTLQDIDQLFILQMISMEAEKFNPSTVNQRITILSNFFDYLCRIEFIEINPLDGITHYKRLYYRPYVFSPKDLAILSDRLSKRLLMRDQEKYFLARLSHYTALSIQAECGLRISEVINLKIKDFDPLASTLYIEKTKFRKNRLIPIAHKTSIKISNYLNTRRSLIKVNKSSPYIFLSFLENKSNRKTVSQHFRMNLDETGIYHPPRLVGNTIIGSPCTHSLRHSFAVNTIRRWKAQGRDIDQIADTLATYMGHSSFVSTQVYLKALNHSPEILIYRYGDKG